MSWSETPRVAQHPKLPGQASIAIQALLSRQLGQAHRLCHVAVVSFDNLQFQFQPAQADQAHDVIQTNRGTAPFPTGDRGLDQASTVGQLDLGKTSPLTSLADQLRTVRAHSTHITNALYARELRPSAALVSENGLPPDRLDDIRREWVAWVRGNPGAARSFAFWQLTMKAGMPD